MFVDIPVQRHRKQLESDAARANQNTPGLWGGGGGVVRLSAGPEQSPCGDQGGEAPESSKIITF